MSKQKKKAFEPNAFIIVFGIMIFCAILTWIIPAGSFDRVIDTVTDKEIVVAGSFHTVESNPVGPWKFFNCFFNGFVDAADIMFFILFATSYVYVLSKSNALNAFIGRMLRLVGNKDYLVIPVFFMLFAIGGTTFGMFEETYALIPVFIVIAKTLGYDRMVGGALVYLGVATGFSAAIINPFTIGVAAGVAGVPLVDTKVTIFRTIAFVLFSVLICGYLMRYAARVRKDPTKSYLYGVQDDLTGMMTREECMEIEFTTSHKISMIGFVILLVILVWGIISKGWWFSDISSLFLVFMIITGFVNKMSVNDLADALVESTKNSVYAMLLVGFSRGISIVMTEGSIIDSVVNALASVVQVLPASLTGIGMLIVQNLINFFIPSGSGQAVVMMPIMAPLADITGVSRQMACIAYQFGDGFSNMIFPTAVALECGIMGISLKKWYKLVLPLFGLVFALECVLLVVGIMIGI